MKHLVFSIYLLAACQVGAGAVIVSSTNPKAIQAVEDFAQQALTAMEAESSSSGVPAGILVKQFKEQLAQFGAAGFEELGPFSVYKENDGHRPGSRNFGQSEYFSLLELAEMNPWFASFKNKLDILRSWMATRLPKGRIFLVKRIKKNIDPQGFYYFLGEVRLVVSYREVRDGNSTKILLHAESIESELHQYSGLEGGGSSAGHR